MNFTYDGNLYKFVRVKNEHGHKVDTLCLLRTDDDTDWWLIGESRLHPKDNNKFNKAIGKVMAFSYGLRNLEFDRQYRLSAMNEFIKNLPKGVLIDKKQLGRT